MRSGCYSVGLSRPSKIAMANNECSSVPIRGYNSPTALYSLSDLIDGNDGEHPLRNMAKIKKGSNNLTLASGLACA